MWPAKMVKKYQMGYILVFTRSIAPKVQKELALERAVHIHSLTHARAHTHTHTHTDIYRYLHFFIFVFVFMGWSLLPNALRPFKIYCAPPNLDIWT